MSATDSEARAADDARARGTPPAWRPLPPRSRARWRRLDGRGGERSSIERVRDGWRCAGVVEVDDGSRPYRLRYLVECDAAWRTAACAVDGRVGRTSFRATFDADRRGGWRIDGAAAPELAGAFDVDLGFTPSTNLLPLRRLDLAVGASASVASAWLRFPELRIERLEQTYRRVADSIVRYRALVDGETFEARLDVDAYGRVVRYEGLWERVAASPE
ncbi:MAG TPA: putative glycolipid-binding domain-containing protein [Planctomycetota bacterium]|nr:putative glycolipid-binding domain-containing protein [Planctomycetota bacterium]